MRSRPEVTNIVSGLCHNPGINCYDFIRDFTGD